MESLIPDVEDQIEYLKYKFKERVDEDGDKELLSLFERILDNPKSNEINN